MARHAQPRELAELKGATRHDPQRYAKKPAKSGFPLGQAPDSMSEAAKSVWFELETYALQGVLTGADRFVLELTSTLMAEFRNNPPEFAVGKYGQLIGCLARLGLTPADRQKFGTGSAESENPFDEF